MHLQRECAIRTGHCTDAIIKIISRMHTLSKTLENSDSIFQMVYPIICTKPYVLRFDSHTMTVFVFIVTLRKQEFVLEEPFNIFPDSFA